MQTHAHTRLDVSVEGTHRGVVLQKVRGLLHAAAVVHRHNLQVAVGAALHAAQELAADAAKAVDGHAQLLGAHGHLAGAGANLQWRGRGPQGHGWRRHA